MISSGFMVQLFSNSTTCSSDMSLPPALWVIDHQKWKTYATA
jgi:hypothetical protein